MRRYALLLSALCHDIGHGGRTNNLLVTMGDALAITYNDTSVLENHHAASTYRILAQACGYAYTSRNSSDAPIGEKVKKRKVLCSTCTACANEWYGLSW